MIASSDSRSGSEVPQRRCSPSCRRVLADLGGADQQLKRAAEPAALAGDDQIVHALLRRVPSRPGQFRDTGLMFSSFAADRPAA